MTNVALSAIDYSHFYQQIETQGNVPNASSTTIDANHALIQQMYVDLGDVQAALRQSDFDPPLVTIYADVLNIPEGSNYLLQNAVLMVLARRIQAGANARFDVDYRSATSASLVAFCDEIDGSIAVVATTLENGSPKAWPFVLSAAPSAGGVQFLLQDGTPMLTPRTRQQGLSAWPPTPFEQAMSSEFIFASLLYDQQPDLALAMFTWVKEWTVASPNLLPVFLSSASMISLLSAQINAQQNGAAFVPFLTAEIYTQLAAAYAQQAQDYETKYMALSTQKVVTDEMIQQAQALLDNQSYQSDYVSKLLVQAQSNYDNAQAAVNSAQAQFELAKRQVESVKIDFEDKGIPEWEREEIAKAVIGIISAVVTFGVGIAGMLVGDEATAPAAAEGVADAAEAAEEAAKIGGEIATIAKQLADVMKQLKKIQDGMAKITAFVQAVIDAAKNIQNAQAAAAKMAAMDTSTDGADLTATYQWQIYQLNSDAALAGPIQKGVGYATDLKTAIDAVAIYGQGLAAAQLAAVTAGQQYAKVQLQLALAQQQQARLQQLVDSLKAGEPPIVAMMQLLYQRYLDVKSGLFAALENYRASYFYWALDGSSVDPRIIDPVDKIDSGLKDITAIALDTANALSHFEPNPPQPLTQQLLEVTDEAVLQQLRDGGTASWTIRFDDPNFNGKDRVRLSTIRVWLDHTQPATAGDYYVEMTIKSTGNYLDRFNGTNYQFTSEPLQRDFKYRVSAVDQAADWRFSDGSFGYVTIDGSVDNLVRYAYFEPTPFSQWKIDLAAKGAGLDLSGVTKLTLELSGSIISQAMLSKAAA